MVAAASRVEVIVSPVTTFVHIPVRDNTNADFHSGRIKEAAEDRVT
jgi:hypothetical protein